MILDKDILQKIQNKDKIIYIVKLSKLDEFNIIPNINNSNIYFILKIKDKNVKFFNFGEYCDAFDKDYAAVLLFKPKNKKFKNIELHIINDYD